jgi:polar amino acid transport system substrate-binding protein
MRCLKTFVGTLILTAFSVTANGAELKFNTQDFAPYSFDVGGSVSGPGVEIISQACAKIDVKCSFALLPWGRAQKEVKAGKAHGMFVIGWNKARHKWVHFSPPILKAEYGFFTHSSNALAYTDLKDVEGLTVAVYGPSNTSKSLKALQTKMQSAGMKPIKIDERPHDEAGFKKLALKRVDAVFSNRDVGFAVAAKVGVKDKVRYAGKTRELNYYIGLAVEHNDPALLEKFNSAVSELDKAGAIRKILDKYGMLPADPKLIPADFNKR